MKDNALQHGMISLIRSAVTGEMLSVPAGFDIAKACLIAKNHRIVGMLYYGIKNCKIVLSEQIEQKLFSTTAQALMLSENQTAESEKIFDTFEKHKIDYLPLKGLLLKRLYPTDDMRTMGDADILIRTENYESIHPLMVQLGYTEIKESEHELVWDKPGLLYVELHKCLIPPYNKDYHAYYGDGWQLAKPAGEDSCRYIFSNEDNFIYLFTHFAKHYRNGGIGIKHVVDLWVFLRNYKEIDYGYIENELDKLQLLEFYKNVRRLISVWFEDVGGDEITDLLGDVIFNSGAFGTQAASLASQLLKRMKSESYISAKFHGIIKVVFLNYSAMSGKYKILKTIPILLPVMWVVRWFQILLFKHDKIKKYKKDTTATSEKAVTEYQAHLNAVGLDFNFKE